MFNTNYLTQLILPRGNRGVDDRYFLMIKVAFMGLGEEVPLITSHDLITVDVNPDHMAEVVPVKVPTVKLLFFLRPFHIVFFGRKSHSPQLRSEGCAPPPSGHSSYTHDLEFFCIGDYFTLYFGL